MRNAPALAGTHVQTVSAADFSIEMNIGDRVSVGVTERGAVRVGSVEDAIVPQLLFVGEDEIRGLGPNTSRRIRGRAKQFFRAAIRKRLAQENPFADGKSHVQWNREGDFFVMREMAATVLDACPDADWRLIFALSRYGGLRCPSEHLARKWGVR